MSNDRSPRDVCSITIGINGLIDWSPERCSYGLLATGGPQLRFGGGLFLFGRPELVARFRELDRDRLRLGGQSVECCLQPQVLAKALVVTVRPDIRDHLVGVLAGR